MWDICNINIYSCRCCVAMKIPFIVIPVVYPYLIQALSLS